MTMLKIPNLPTPSFDEPVALLRACHMKMLLNATTLEKLATHIQSNGVDDQAIDAASNIRRYFNEAAPLHHQDEEKDLFPLLLTLAPELKGTICELNSEHQDLEESWQVLDELLADLNAIEDIDAFAELAQAFGQAYRDHIKEEEAEILMPIDGKLNEQQLAQLGKAMAARRGASNEQD